VSSLLRRSPRYPVKVPILIKVGGLFVELSTEDVSFRGVFAYTDEALHIGQLISLELWLPPKGESLKVQAKIVHEVERRHQPGIGLEFFAVGRDEETRWDAFITRLRDDFPTIAGRASRLARASRFDPIRKREARHTAVFRVEMQTALDLQNIYNRDVAKGGLFVLTDEVVDLETAVGLQLIHPNTEDVFELSGIVRRQVEQHGIRGLGIDFVGLDQERRERLHDFVYDGIADLFDEESIAEPHTT